MSIICNKHHIVIKIFADGTYRLICEKCNNEFKVRDVIKAYPDKLIPTHELIQLLKRERSLR